MINVAQKRAREKTRERMREFSCDFDLFSIPSIMSKKMLRGRKPGENVEEKKSRAL
jgi:hypothetical protein